MITNENKKSLKTSLKKIKGLCQKIETMVESDAYCMDILQQGNAGKGLFEGFSKIIVKNHLQTCGVKKLTAIDEADRNAFIDEFINILHRSKK